MAVCDFDLTEILAGITAESHPEGTRSRQRREKGLPSDDALRDLAATYLKLQHKSWPELANAQLLPKKTEANVAKFAAEFKHHFLADGVETCKSEAHPSAEWLLGAAYLRYSDAGSNPRSLAQQLVNILERARRDNCFIPWEHVYADAAVTGTVAARRGYQMAKALIGRGNSPVGILYIDEIGRASRDCIEALNLGRLIDQSGKRMIGAADGFDSANPTSKLQLAIFAMLHEYFVDQLRAKVKRGMRDAFERGRNIHPPAVGYKLVPVEDAAGRPVIGDDGRPVTERVVDEAVAPDLVKGATLFAEGGWSRGKVARLFNEKQVGGMQTWSDGQVKQMLQRCTYRGYEFNEMTYQIRDPGDGKVTVKTRPEKEWKRREVPDLRVFPPELCQKIDERLATTKAAYDRMRKNRGPSRTEVYPNVLIRPICGVCRKPLWLGRSGKYASFHCLSGLDGKGGCTLKGYKSVRIVEEAILRHIASVMFTDAFVQRVVEQANHFLAEQPKATGTADIKRLEAEIRRRQRAIQGITQKLGQTDDAVDLQPIFDRVAELRREITDLQKQIAAVQGTRGLKPMPLTTVAVQALIDDLRPLLQGDIATAAPVLTALTGPVVVTNGVRKNTNKREWIARFTMNTGPVMLALARKRTCPTTSTWEYLSARNWTTPEKVQVPLKHTPKFERLSRMADDLVAKGASVDTVARTFGAGWQTVRDSLEFARTGRRPVTKPAGKRGQRRGPPKYLELADEVVRLRDEHIPFEHIAKSLKTSRSTVTRAYDHRRPEAVRAAAERGRRPQRGQYSRLGPSAFERVRAGLIAGAHPRDIAADVGCGVSTVNRVRTEMRQADEPRGIWGPVI